jgi:hypothetical protein
MLLFPVLICLAALSLFLRLEYTVEDEITLATNHQCPSALLREIMNLIFLPNVLISLPHAYRKDRCLPGISLFYGT